MLKYGYVPSDFSCGLLVPIPKDSSLRDILMVDNLRGITLSPIISNFLEHCLRILYNEDLFSSDRQFGFKKY